VNVMKDFSFLQINIRLLFFRSLWTFFHPCPTCKGVGVKNISSGIPVV
jgi:hypothetical protein